MGNMDHYERDFEEVMLQETGSYYKRKAAEWINQDSCPDYMLKVRWGVCGWGWEEHCQRHGADRVGHGVWLLQQRKGAVMSARRHSGSNRTAAQTACSRWVDAFQGQYQLWSSAWAMNGVGVG